MEDDRYTEDYEFPEEDDRLYPRTWFVHLPTGTRCFKKGYAYFLPKGTKVAEKYDQNCKLTYSMELLKEGGCIKDGKIVKYANIFLFEEVDFAITGTMPTPETLALWKEIKP